MPDIKIVFMGTPDFAVPCLDALVAENYRVVGCVTQPDRPKGRGQKLICPPVKDAAMRHAIPVLQPETLRDPHIRQQLAQFGADLFVVVAYGLILPRSVLAMPRSGCVNVHASYLPAYRGAAPINWSIVRGESGTGVTTMLMDRGMDTGPMLLRERESILPNDTAQTLHDRLARKGAALLVETLPLFLSGKLSPQPQNESDASYAPLIKKEDGRIDWQQSALQIFNQIRGFTPWPGTYTFLSGQMLKIFQATLRPSLATSPEVAPGTVVAVGTGEILIQTGAGCLALQELQLSNRNRMSCADFLRGAKITVGMRLENPATTASSTPL
jgi:methionyl-tRNA formyltransferase